MAKEQIHVGLEIGTTKICAVVAESRDDGPLRILGIGQAPSRGVRKGEIVEFSTASKCVREALADAEEKSDVEIRSVWAAVTGSHIQSFNNRGAINIPEEKNEIDEFDLQDIETNAKEVSIPSSNAFLHSIIQHYYIDGQEGVLDPLGMVGHKLEADFHIVHGVRTRIQNTIRCVKEAGIEVEDVVLNSLASAQVVVTQQQKDLGIIVIDIGGGITDYIVYVDGSVRCSGVLAIGGDHITNDLSIGLRIPITRAEKLKIEEGSALIHPPTQTSQTDTIILKNDSGFSGCEIHRASLNTIINARINELFQLLRRQIQDRCPLELVGAGIVITGGCSQLKGIKEIAQQAFEMPVKIANAQGVAGPTSAWEDPRLSTAIGLVKYAQATSADIAAPSFFDSFKSLFKRRS